MDILLPKNSLTMTEAELVVWYVAEGDEVKAGSPMFAMETEKSQVDVDAPASGRLVSILRVAGDVVTAGEVIAVLEQSGSAPAQIAAGRTSSREVALGARELAASLGVNIDSVRGTGTDGRVSEDDVIAAAGQDGKSVSTTGAVSGRLAGSAAAAPGVVPATSVPDFSRSRRAGNRATLAALAAPDFQLAADVDLPRSGRSGAGTTSDVLLAAAGIALRAVPIANAVCLDGEPRLYRDVRVGLLVRPEDALLPLVFADPDKRSMSELHGLRRSLLEAATSGSLPVEVVTSPTFVISNIGRPGISWFSAVLYPGTAATMAVGSRGATPDGKTTVVLTCDHRVLDGVDAADFVSAFSDALADV